MVNFMHTKEAMVSRLRTYIAQSIRKDNSTVILYLNEVEDIIKFLSTKDDNCCMECGLTFGNHYTTCSKFEG